jgi:uncharacterized protein (TIGR03066 family)
MTASRLFLPGCLLLGAASIIACSGVPTAPKPADPGAAKTFAGTWDTNFGPVVLTQDGEEVKGTYGEEGSTLKGKVEKNKLTFTYTEPGATGEGWFALAEDGQSFDGKYRETGETDYADWTGKRAAGAAADKDKVVVNWGLRLRRNKDKVIGIWQAPKSQDFPFDVTLEFTPDGKMITTLKATPPVKKEATYSVEGAKINTTRKENGKEVKDAWTITSVTDKKLVLVDGKGKTTEYTKK